MKQEKLDKRAAALRDNLKKRKEVAAKAKQQKQQDNNAKPQNSQ